MSKRKGQIASESDEDMAGQEEEEEYDPQQYSKLPKHIEEQRTRVRVGAACASNTETVAYHGTYKAYGVDHSFKFGNFKKNFQVKIMESTAEHLVFDMIGIDAPLANAFRRIMLSEVPTMAIETVVIENNTSIIQDEILAHRLGLVPIKVDPRHFVFRSNYAEKNKTIIQNDGSGGELWDPQQYQLFDNQVICFKLDVTCPRSKKGGDENRVVYSKDLKWVPIGKQAEFFKDNPIRPVHDDIIIAKLRPGQAITAELYCEKGIGKTHAKWSPVATASYRMLPEVTLLEELKNEEAEALYAKCPMNVFEIVDRGHEKTIKVARPRNCTMCRECIREEGWDKKVKLTRVKDHFIFSIESVGMLSPEDIFTESVKILFEKCQLAIDQLSNRDEKQE